MLEPETQVAGAVVIFDMDGLSLQQTWQFTPSFAKRIVDFLQVGTQILPNAFTENYNFSVLGCNTCTTKKFTYN